MAGSTPARRTPDTAARACVCVCVCDAPRSIPTYTRARGTRQNYYTRSIGLRYHVDHTTAWLLRVPKNRLTVLS